MLKITQLGSGAGIQIPTILLQFRNKIDFLPLWMDNKQTYKNINKGCMGKVPVLGKEEKKSYAKEIISQ